MGILQSIHSLDKITYEKRVTKLGNDFTKKKFIKARSSSTIVKRTHEIKKYGTCLKDRSSEFISKDSLDKVCFIIINTYKSRHFHLGVGPMNDAIIVASDHKKRGYKVFYLHNSTRNQFLTYLKFFLQYTQKTLTIFYSGRTTTLQHEKGNLYDDNTENHKDKFVKAMIFEQGYVADLDIGTLLTNFKLSRLKVVFISDSCHYGPVWDFNSPIFRFQNLPDKIISISVNMNDDISDYDKLLITNDGIFTICFWNILKDTPNITPIQLKEKIGPQLQKFGLSIVYHTTSNNLDEEPIFM